MVGPAGEHRFRFKLCRPLPFDRRARWSARRRGPLQAPCPRTRPAGGSPAGRKRPGSAKWHRRPGSPRRPLWRGPPPRSGRGRRRAGPAQTVPPSTRARLARAAPIAAIIHLILLISRLLLPQIRQRSAARSWPRVPWLARGTGPRRAAQPLLFAHARIPWPTSPRPASPMRAGHLPVTEGGAPAPARLQQNCPASGWITSRPAPAGREQGASGRGPCTSRGNNDLRCTSPGRRSM